MNCDNYFPFPCSFTFSSLIKYRSRWRDNSNEISIILRRISLREVEKWSRATLLILTTIIYNYPLREIHSSIHSMKVHARTKMFKRTGESSIRSSITVINAYVCVRAYTLENGKEKQPEFHWRTRLSPAQVYSDARNPRFEESWISKACMRMRQFPFHPRFIALLFRVFKLFPSSSFPPHLPPSLSPRAHVLPRLTFLRIVEPDTLTPSRSLIRLIN